MVSPSASARRCAVFGLISVLVTHPGVADAAVIGTAHPHTGETVRAFVVASDDVSVEEDDVIGHCAEGLAAYKCPTKVTFVTDIPRNEAGKILYRDLSA